MSVLGLAGFGRSVAVVVSTAVLTIAAAAGLVVTGQRDASASTTVAVVPGESMTSVQGYGARVRSSATADGGRFLLVDSAVTVKANVTLSTSVTELSVRLRTSNGGTGGARAQVTVDGIAVTTLAVTATTWTAYRVPGAVAPGTHVLAITFTNPASRNLYIDSVALRASTPVASPSPSAGSPTSAAPAPTPTSGASNEIRSQAYLTGYSYWDNTPAGSAAISDPVLHTVAGGTGTYADPITIAVGHSIINGKDILDFPKGTRFYVPNLRRYFIVEDTCGDGRTPQNGPCHTGYPSGASFWLDLWVGGGSVTSSAADTCMSNLTDIHLVIQNPASTYAVVTGEIATRCSQYGDGIVSS